MASRIFDALGQPVRFGYVLDRVEQGRRLRGVLELSEALPVRTSTARIGTPMTRLVQGDVAVSNSLEQACIPSAFGGAMVESNAVDLLLAAERLAALLGDDPRVARLRNLALHRVTPTSGGSVLPSGRTC